MTGARPTPISANHSDIVTVPVSAARKESPKQATAVLTMPSTSGTRGPMRVMSAPAAGEPTIIIPVSGSRCSPLLTGVIPRTFCR